MVDQNSPYTYVKYGVYYYSKRIPKDLHHHYQVNRLALCLHTRSASKAGYSAVALLAKLEDYWLKLRLSEIEIPAANKLISSTEVSSTAITLKEALALYLKLKGKSKQKQFEITSNRNVNRH